MLCLNNRARAALNAGPTSTARRIECGDLFPVGLVFAANNGTRKTCVLRAGISFSQDLSLDKHLKY